MARDYSWQPGHQNVTRALRPVRPIWIRVPQPRFSGATVNVQRLPGIEAEVVTRLPPCFATFASITLRAVRRIRRSASCSSNEAPRKPGPRFLRPPEKPMMRFLPAETGHSSRSLRITSCEGRYFCATTRVSVPVCATHASPLATSLPLSSAIPSPWPRIVPRRETRQGASVVRLRR